jgi:hypothetical protein
MAGSPCLQINFSAGLGSGRVKPHKSYHRFFLVDAESAACVGELCCDKLLCAKSICLTRLAFSPGGEVQEAAAIVPRVF